MKTLEDNISKEVTKTFQDFFVQKDFANALLVLEKNRPEFSPGVWHYNVGTIKAQTQQFAEARFHFLKAQEFGFNQKANLDNLKIVEEKLEITRLEKPLTTSDYLIKASLWAKDGAFTTISLILLVVGLVRLRKSKSLKVAGLFAVLMLVPLLANFWINNWSREIVIQPQLVQEGPSAIFAGNTELPAGVLLITKHRGEWYQIIYPSRFSGWIKAAGVKSLENEE